MIRLFLLVAVLGLAGCMGTPPRERFYMLTAPEPATGAAAYSVAVGPATLPEVVDRPQMVMRVGANQVAITEQARWAEPLKSAIPRVVAANLAQILGARASAQARGDADFRILLDVQRFESTPGEGVLLDVHWTVVPAKGDRRSGHSLAREAAKGKDYEGLAAAHSAALARVSSEIAGAIRTLTPN